MSRIGIPSARRRRLAPEGVERRGKFGKQPVWNWYRSCGLTIRSQLELPEFFKIEPLSNALDVVDIVIGNVPSTLKNGRTITGWLQADDQKCLISSPNAARYLVEDGARITVDRRVQATHETACVDGDVRAYLLGTVLGALLHQREWLPLHISAVKTDIGAVAFTGASGAGKSTLAAFLHYRLNFPLVSDDLAVLKPDDQQPLLYPGPPRLKLWINAIEALGVSPSGLTRDLTREDKFHLHRNLRFQHEPERLTKLVVLTKGEEGRPTVIRRIRGIEAYRVFMQSIYRSNLRHLFSTQKRLHDIGGKIASKIEFYEYRRPWNLARLEQDLNQLCATLSLATRG